MDSSTAPAIPAASPLPAMSTTTPPTASRTAAAAERCRKRSGPSSRTSSAHRSAAAGVAEPGCHLAALILVRPVGRAASVLRVDRLLGRLVLALASLHGGAVPRRPAPGTPRRG